MNPTRTCPKCAAPRRADAPQGHCPQCLLSLALAAQPGPDTAAALEQATLDTQATALGVPPGHGVPASAGHAPEPPEGGTPNQRKTPNPTVRLTSPTEKPGDTIGRYKLLQKVGEGGCGTVYMAEQSEPVRRKRWWFISVGFWLPPHERKCIRAAPPPYQPQGMSRSRGMRGEPAYGWAWFADFFGLVPLRYSSRFV